jgi:hypothetical protein
MPDFKKAFSNARKLGLAQFSHNGKLYNTQVKNETNSLLQLPLTDKIRNESKQDKSLKHVNEFNTGLNPNELKEFHDWGIQRYGGLDNVLYEMGNYDLQGAWKDIKSGKIKFDPSNGHLPDTYKNQIIQLLVIRVSIIIQIISVVNGSKSEINGNSPHHSKP